jgi:hypothetical protein
MPGRQAYVSVGVAAAVPCLVLAAAAPGGHDWVYLEYPRHITMIAIALGIAACFRRSVGWAVFVPILTAGIALAWALVDEYVGLSKLGRTDLFHEELDLLCGDSVARVAPWLMGGLYGVLALAAIRRRGSERRQLVPAGAWLAATGAITALVTFQVKDWLTFENLSQPGTFRSGVPWCDSQVLSLIVSLAACAGGVVLVAIGLRRPETIPRAVARERAP